MTGISSEAPTTSSPRNSSCKFEIDIHPFIYSDDTVVIILLALRSTEFPVSVMMGECARSQQRPKPKLVLQESQKCAYVLRCTQATDQYVLLAVHEKT